MEQKENTNYQETIAFGKVDVYIEPLTSNDCIDDTLSSSTRSSSTAQETLSTQSTGQNERHTANYGPCIVCKVNKVCVLFVGCNHLACCGRCSETCGNFCPVPNCSRPIIDRLRVFEPI